MKQEHNFKSTFLCGKINFNKEVEKHADAETGKKARGSMGGPGAYSLASLRVQSLGFQVILTGVFHG